MPRAKLTHEHDSFRDLLKELRVGSGITQMELAERLGTPQSYVSKYETGERSLDFVETSRVCAALGVDVVAFSRRFLDRVSHRASIGLKRRIAK